MKNGQLFKLRYTYIDVCKDCTGTLRCLELGGGPGQQSPFIHACEYSLREMCWTRLTVIVHNTKLPVPHLEHPKTSDDFPLRISFLDQQTVQTSHVVFLTQLSYKFENWDGMYSGSIYRDHTDRPDCVRFQELLLGSKLIFLGGMAEAKSKGRGEECISQNLRILRGQNGKRVMLFFANSQRGQLKRYVSIPCECILHLQGDLSLTATVNCVENMKPPKKPGRPVVVELNPNFEILSQMRSLSIEFLDNEGELFRLV